eukprot:sb/3472512/
MASNHGYHLCNCVCAAEMIVDPGPVEGNGDTYQVVSTTNSTAPTPSEQEIEKRIRMSRSSASPVGFNPKPEKNMYQMSNACQEPTETSKQPMRTRYLGHVTGYQLIRDQYFLIGAVPDTYLLSLSSRRTSQPPSRHTSEMLERKIQSPGERWDAGWSTAITSLSS